MTDSNLLAFVVLVAFLIITPGADTMVLLRNALRGGRRAAILSVLGGRCGLLVHAALSMLGLSAVLAQSANAFQLVKLAGAGYLVWLGIQSIRAAVHGQASTPAKDLRPALAHSPWSEGLLTNVLNPKTALFYLAILPQFVRPEDTLVSRSILLVTIHIGLSLLWYLGLVVAVDSTQTLVTRNRKVLDATSGLFMVVLGLKLAFSER